MIRHEAVAVIGRETRRNEATAEMGRETKRNEATAEIGQETRCQTESPIIYLDRLTPQQINAALDGDLSYWKVETNGSTERNGAPNEKKKKKTKKFETATEKKYFLRKR